MSEDDILQIAVPTLAIAAQLFCLYRARRCERRHRLVTDLPVSKTTGVFIGMVDVRGVAESPAPAISHLTDQRCVWHRWSVSESWSKEVTETYTDSDGKRQTRTTTKSGWTTIASGGEEPPFVLRDDHGGIQIVPAGADIEPLLSLDQTCGRRNPLYYHKGPAAEIANSDHQRQFREEIILVGAPLCIVGQARERSDIIAPEIAKDARAPLYLISTHSGSDVATGYRRRGIAWGVIGLLPIAILAGMDLADVDSPWPEPAIIPWAAGIYISAWFFGWLSMAYNSLIELRQRVRQAWANVDVQIKRRADLIPNLVAIVDAMHHHEADTLSQVAHLRQQATTTPPGIAGPDAQACAPLLTTLVERYPTLTSNRAFTDLTRLLSDCEERIALARAYFNDIASFLNTHRETIPDRYIATVAGISAQTLMLADGFERAAPQVRLGPSTSTNTPATPALDTEHMNT